MWNEAWEMSGNKRIDADPQRAYIKGLYLLRSKLKTFVLQMTLLGKGKAGYGIGENICGKFIKP